MIRKIFFWLHLSAGVTAGLFIFIMAATGVVLAFERQIVDFVDRDVRSVAVPNDAHPLPLNHQLDAVRQAGLGAPTAVSLRNEPQAATQFSIGRGKTVYVDPYSGAVLGASSVRAHEFFFTVERIHRALGAQLAPKAPGRQVIGIANLLFSVLILLGLVLWVPRQWSGRAFRAVIAFRGGLGAKAREWNWHNVIGIWCAVPLLVISLSGVVMSFDRANALLFRMAGSVPPAFGRDGGDRRPQGRDAAPGQEPNYDELFTAAKVINTDWRTITLNVARDAKAPMGVTVDTGSGGQPQYRTQYVLAGETGAVVKTNSFSDGSLGQRLRAFVRFGHTGEYGGWPGQLIAVLASLGACVLVYTGVSLSVRRLAAKLNNKRRKAIAVPDSVLVA